MRSLPNYTLSYVSCCSEISYITWNSNHKLYNNINTNSQMFTCLPDCTGLKNIDGTASLLR